MFLKLKLVIMRGLKLITYRLVLHRTLDVTEKHVKCFENHANEAKIPYSSTCSGVTRSLPNCSGWLVAGPTIRVFKRYYPGIPTRQGRHSWREPVPAIARSGSDFHGAAPISHLPPSIGTP